MAGLTRICLTMLLVSCIQAVMSESKQNDIDAKGKTALNKKEMESTIKQKTAQAIKKLENQFKSTFMAYTTAKGQSKRQDAHDNFKHLVSVVKRDAGQKLENSVKGFQFDVTRLSDKDTERALESSYIRQRRSKYSWGSCKSICKQRCLPTCNLVCCIAPPYNVPRKTVKLLQKQLGRKSARKKSHVKKNPKQKKKSTIKHHQQKKTSMVKKEKKKGGACNVKCQKACLPSCDFRCCIAPKKH